MAVCLSVTRSEAHRFPALFVCHFVKKNFFIVEEEDCVAAKQLVINRLIRLQKSILNIF